MVFQANYDAFRHASARAIKMANESQSSDGNLLEIVAISRHGAGQLFATLSGHVDTQKAGAPTQSCAIQDSNMTCRKSGMTGLIHSAARHQNAHPYPPNTPSPWFCYRSSNNERISEQFSDCPSQQSSKRNPTRSFTTLNWAA